MAQDDFGNKIKEFQTIEEEKMHEHHLAWALQEAESYIAYYGYEAFMFELHARLMHQ